MMTVDLSNDGSDRPVELLKSESNGCVVKESVLVPEMSPVVSARGTAVPMSLPTISEVFSSAVLAGGLLLRRLPWPWQGQSQRECLSCRTLEANFQLILMGLPWSVRRSWTVDDALDVVGLHVGQLWFRTEPDDVLPVMLDEHSLMHDFVWPDVIPANRDFVSADVCGDDRFSPGVRNAVSLDWRMDLDSHGMAKLFSSAVLAGGGGVVPGCGRDSHSASVCPAGRWKRTSSGI